MPDEMLAHKFPCGEQSCYEDANYEYYTVMALGDVYVIPVCYEHAMVINVWVERLESILEKAKKAGFDD